MDSSLLQVSRDPLRSGDQDGTPLVSIVVPCRNEGQHIERCVRSILAQQPPVGGFEVIVADGMSEDGTKAILSRLASEDSRLQIVDNPGKTAPCARNAGIRIARGSYIAILDAHTEYASDYIKTCVQLLEEHPEVCCSGGPIISRGNTVFGRAAAAAMSHPLGVGNAKHRFPDYEGYAEGACFPVFRREIFTAVGLFDEQLVRNQDDEFNYRVACSGGKIYLSPRARCTYYVREAPSQLFLQYFQYGYWRVAVLKKHHRPASVRHVAPLAFFLMMLISTVVLFILPSNWRIAALTLPLLYLLAMVVAGFGTAKREGLRTGLNFVLAVAIMHIAYGAGFTFGLLGRKNRLVHALSR